MIRRQPTSPRPDSVFPYHTLFRPVLIGGTLGSERVIAAGYFGGKVDLVISFIISVRLSMPVVLVALAVVAIVGGSLTIVIVVLGLLLWDRFAVVMRGAVMQVRSQDYVVSARAAGCSTAHIVQIGRAHV